MSADVLYRELELNGYRVEDSWNGQDGSVFVLISVPRESLCCRVVVRVSICTIPGNGSGKPHRWV